MSRFNRPRRSRPWGKILLAAVVLALVAFAVLAFVRVGPAPTIAIEPELPGLGPRTPVVVRLSEPTRGLADWRVELLQQDAGGGEQSWTLEERANEPRPFWAFWGPLQADDEVRLEVGRETVRELREGTATIRVVAERAGTVLRTPEPTVEVLELPVRLRAPDLQPVREPYLVAEGGSGVVVYRVGPEAVSHGVLVGDLFVAGRPLVADESPASDETSSGELQFAFYGIPDDFTETLAESTDGAGDDPARAVRLTAVDELGNRIEQPFLQRFVARQFTSDDIRVDDAFLERVVPPIVARTAEIDDGPSLVETYVTINSELRRRNAERLVELWRASRPELLWRGAFSQLPNSVVTGNYGDRRTYFYDDREIDRATHLGFDLASVREAEIPAANAGTVVLADFFGIYGNTVVIDHGFGVLSLYSHLSEIGVAEGDAVEKGRTIGRTGVTGLAGGDHLHFTMLVGGVQVTPIEWWDRGWIENRVASKIGDTFELGR